MRRKKSREQKITDDMGRSWLVQRLARPHRGTGPLAGLDNAFSFGGGLKNGGLTDEAMGLLREIFRFDYMGAAEFEFGAVPKALQGLAADHKDLVGATFDVDLATVPGSWDDDGPAPTGTAPIYLIARAHQADEAKARILAWASESLNDLKEQTNLNTTLRPSRDWHGEAQGWLELNNGFMFFTDEDMAVKTATLFGVDVEKEGWA